MYPEHGERVKAIRRQHHLVVGSDTQITSGGHVTEPDRILPFDWLPFDNTGAELHLPVGDARLRVVQRPRVGLVPLPDTQMDCRKNTSVLLSLGPTLLI